MRKYQTFSQRLAAAILDSIVFVPVFYLLPMAFNINTELSIHWLLFSNGLYYFYSVYAHARYGYTLGKKWMSIKVVCNSNEAELLSFRNSFMRDIIAIALLLLDITLIATDMYESAAGLIISFFATFGWIMAELITMFLNPKRRSVHDLIAASVVINIPLPGKLQSNYRPEETTGK